MSKINNMLKTIVQFIFFAIWAIIGNLIQEGFDIPIPGFIMGFFIVLILLKLNIVKLEWCETGANFLIANMILFFVPSLVGIVKYQDLMRAEGLRLIVVIIAGTLTVMIIIAHLIQFMEKSKEKKEYNELCQ